MKSTNVERTFHQLVITKKLTQLGEQQKSPIRLYPKMSQSVKSAEGLSDDNYDNKIQTIRIHKNKLFY